jgi:GT2 family glycosyltransferase
MTLAPARPTATAPAARTGAVPPVVTAVLVSRPEPAGTGEALTALLAQTLLPDEVLVVDRTCGAVLDPDPGAPGERHRAASSPERDGAAEPEVAAVAGDATDGHVAEDPGEDTSDEVPAGLPLTLADLVATIAETTTVAVTVVAADPRVPVRRVVHDAVAAHEPPADAPSLLWFLPVGTTPQPSALVALVDAWRRSPSTGLLGPKHLDASAPGRLQALGIRSTRSGRVFARPAPGEPDQGQYDRMSDALAVPFAGTLVERDLLLSLRGWDTSFGDLGADLDLGWRAQASGRRVVVVPTAEMRTEPGVASGAATTGARRRGARRVALARAPWWSTPFLAAWILLTSLLAAAGLLLLKRPRSAGAELSALTAVDPVRGWRSRWRTRHTRVVRRRHLRSLFEPRRSVLTGWADSVHHALVTPRPPIGEEAADLTSRSAFVKVLTHPGVVASLVTATVAGVAARSLGTGVWTGLGAGLTGGELVGTSADAGTLWHAWTDGWTGAGLGGPDPVGPAALVLAGPAWLVAHVPLLPAPASPAGFVVGMTVLLAMPIAAVSAYLALRVVTRSGWLRALGAVAWATSGVAAAGVAQGRLGVAVALVLLPGVLAGLWLVATRRSTATSAFATALALVVLGAFAPVLLVPPVLAALVLTVVRRGARAHALVVAVVPVAMLAPWLVPDVRTAWPVLVAGSGLAQWGGTVPPPWRLALLDPGGPGAPLVWATAPLAAVGVLAVLRRRRWRAAQTTLALVLPLLLGVALLAPGVRLGTVPAGVDGTGESIVLWPGTLLLPVVLVLVAALVRGLDGIRLHHLGRWRLTGTWAVLTTALAAVLVGAVGVAWSTLGDELAAWQDPRPAVAVEQARGAFATRSLFVTPGTRGAGYRLVGREAADVVRPLPGVTEADGQVADGVTALLDARPGGEGLVPAAAVDLLAIRGAAVPDLARRLDATAGLQPISPRDGWQMWRVSPADERGQALVASPRLRMETPEDTRLVETLGDHAATVTTIDAPADSTLVVAEPPGWAEQAVVAVDGEVLRAQAGTTSPTYALPEGPGTLTVTLVDPDRWWHLAQLAGFVVLAFLAVPFGRRESRVTRR